MTDELKRAIIKLKDRISESVEFKDDPNTASWGREIGILITRNEANVIVSELEKPTYTADDIFDFIKWGFTKPGYMRNYFNYFRGDTKGFFTPSELLKK